MRSQMRRGRTLATNPGSESLVSESLESVTSSLLVVAKWNTSVCLHCCNPLPILSVMWTTIPNLWPSVKQSWGHTLVLFGAFRKNFEALGLSSNANSRVVADQEDSGSMCSSGCQEFCCYRCAYHSPRWPDRLQATCCVEGFRIVGPIESSCIFKPLSDVEDPVPIDAQEGFYGEQAKADLYTHLRSRSSQHHKKILEATTVQQQRSWLGPQTTSKENLVQVCCASFRVFFLLQQRLRDRLIDNAKTGKQNHFTQCPETIFSITLDWLGIALKCFWKLCLLNLSALNFLSQNSLTPEFRLMISQTPSKVVQTQQTNVLAVLLYGPSIR